jgi:hypothetical protein
MNVNGISGVRGVASASTIVATSSARATPMLAAPAMSVDDAAGKATGFEGLGIEALAAALAADAAESQAKLAKDEERAHAKEEHDAVMHQVAEMHDKASDMRHEAFWTGVVGVASATFTAASFGAGTERVSRAYTAMADITTKTGGAALKAGYGASELDHEANSTEASGAAKEAEAAKNDAAERRKVAEDAVEKAQAALQEFVQERAMAKRAILRG